MIQNLTIPGGAIDGFFQLDDRQEYSVLSAFTRETIAPVDEILPWVTLPFRTAVTLHGVEDGDPGNAIAQHISAQKASQKKTEMPGQQVQLPAQISGDPTPARSIGRLICRDDPQQSGGRLRPERQQKLYTLYRSLLWL